MALTVDVDVSGVTFAKLKEACKSDACGMYAAVQWLKYYREYMPFGDTGQLENKVKIDPWVITHQAPYAHYQYEGIVYAPSYPIMQHGVVVGYKSPPRKVATGRALKYHHNPKATRHWDQAAIPTKGNLLCQALQAYITEKGN